MVVAYHSSDTFSSVLAVSMASIMENNKAFEDITFYVLEKHISEENKTKLCHMVAEYGRKLVFIPMPNMQDEFNLPIAQVRAKWILDSYCRLFFGSILPNNVERVLYLDCDTLCNDSLDELWNMDLNNNYCAAVTDALGEKYYQLFEMNKTSRYCNSGMVLFDLKKWREDNIENEIAQYVRNHNGYVFFMEQSVMNIILQDRILILHPRYNVYTLISALKYHDLKTLRHCNRFYTDTEYNEAKEKPCIIHLTNLFLIKGRPWVEDCKHPFKDLFLHYRQLTPWREFPLQQNNYGILKKIQFALISIAPKKLLLWILGIVYEYIRPITIARQQKNRQN